MARASVTEENQALATTGWAYISLHTGDPSTTGANECSGGGYARQAIAWNAASGGAVTNSGALSIPLGSQTATYFGIWSASSAGTYYIGGALSGSAVGPTTVTIIATGVSISAA